MQEKGDATKDSTLIKILEGLSVRWYPAFVWQSPRCVFDLELCATFLQLASVHAADSILSQLLEWREYALKVVMDTSRPNHAVLMRSRVRSWLLNLIKFYADFLSMLNAAHHRKVLFGGVQEYSEK